MKLPILYSFKRCPYAMRARMAFYLSNLKCEIREVSLRNKPKEMIRISPKATVPVLDNNNEVLDESMDIINWIIKKNKTNSSEPKIKKEVIVKSPDTLREGQSEFSKTGGIHASGLFNSNGELVAVREDVGRHNALDKLIGCALKNNQIDPKNQFITCSGRLNFELVQKVLMTDIGIMIGVGAPTSLAIDLANKFDMTLIGFVKRDSFNIYTNDKKVNVD